MMIILTHFYIIIVSLCLLYEESDSYENIYNNWTTILVIIFVLDIFHKLNAGYFIQGLQITDRKLIIRRYFESDFVFDFLSFFGLLFDVRFFDTSLSFFLTLFFFFKYPLMEKLIRNVEEVIKFDEKIIALISLVKLFIKMLFLAHIFACMVSNAQYYPRKK